MVIQTHDCPEGRCENRVCLNFLMFLKSVRVPPCSLLQALAAQERLDREAQVGGSRDHLSILQFPGFVCRSEECRRVEFLGRC